MTCIPVDKPVLQIIKIYVLKRAAEHAAVCSETVIAIFLTPSVFLKSKDVQSRRISAHYVVTPLFCRL